MLWLGSYCMYLIWRDFWCLRSLLKETLVTLTAARNCIIRLHSECLWSLFFAHENACLITTEWYQITSQFYSGLAPWHTLASSKSILWRFQWFSIRTKFQLLPGMEEGCIMTLFYRVCNYALCFAVFRLNRFSSMYNSASSILLWCLYNAASCCRF